MAQAETAGPGTPFLWIPGPDYGHAISLEVTVASNGTSIPDRPDDVETFLAKFSVCLHEQ